MKMPTLTLLGAVAFALAFAPLLGCATASLPRSPSACGDPCARLSCPSAFYCSVDSNCSARCMPEPIQPGH
jgi:hypothetical protein